MPVKTVSGHIREIMVQIDRIQSMSVEKRNQFIYVLYGLFKAIQAGQSVIAPLYPDTDLVTPLVEKYRKTVKPSDILDDPPGPFMFGF